MQDSPGNVTRILRAAGAGDRGTADQLLPLVYDELRSLAQSQLARETPGQTLQPTALVHEAYLRLVGNEEIEWESRGHFFASAAEAMRRILIDRARRRAARVHGAGRTRVSLESIAPITDEPPPDEFMAVDEALQRLEQKDPRKARIVMLRYFSGLTIPETAKALGLSERTVKEDWRFARAWLHKEMLSDERPER